jgi:hypothetical protein
MMTDTPLRPVLHNPFHLLAHALRSRPADIPAPAQPLRRHEAPGLFDLVNRIAGKLGVMAPFEIRLVAQAAVAIEAERRWSGRVGKLTIHLGLPLFAWLSRRELGAVIARELGQIVIKAALAPQAREFAADALAARLFGAAAMCAALRKVHLLEPMWCAYFAQDLGDALDCGVRVPVFDGFRRFCAASPKRHEVYDVLDEAPARDTATGDGRPSLDDRLAALAPDVAGRLPRPATCIDLVGGEDGLESLWYGRIEAGDWPAGEWDQFGDAFLRARIGRRFAETLFDPATMPLTELPDVVRALDAWTERLRPEGVMPMSPEVERTYVLAILHDWIVACLCEAGFTLHVRPGMDLILDRYGLAVDPAQLLAAACAGKLKVRDLAGFTRFANTAMA